MPPQKKKPTARAKPAARRAAKKTAAKKTTRKPTKRAATPRPARPSRGSVKAAPDEQPSSARPVAVCSVRPLWETDDVAAATQPTPAPPPRPARETPPAIDRPTIEMVAAGFAVLLAASVFLPWYHSAPGTVSGWTSGTW